MIGRIADGVVDVHAHWLPRELFHLPPGAPYGALADRNAAICTVSSHATVFWTAS